MSDETIIDNMVEDMSNSGLNIQTKSEHISNLLRAKAELQKAEAIAEIARTFNRKIFH